MTNVIKLQRQDALSTLFHDSLRESALSLLPADLAGKAIRLHKAGADAANIASQLRAPLAQVLAVLDRQRARQAKAAAEAREGESDAGDLADAEQGVPADATEAESFASPPPQASSTPTPQPTPPPSTTWPADIELNVLQIKAIKYARTKFKLSFEALARYTRTNPAQIRRICGEEAE